MSWQQKTRLLIENLQTIASEQSAAALANSLSVEDMLITHLILENNIRIDIFSLDTGRLHQDTLQVIDDVRKKYNHQIQVFYPDADDVEKYVAESGINGFYNSVDERKSCCFIRKVKPLKRALQGRDAWLTGLRREQSATRTELAYKEWDEGNNLWKFNPLKDWTEKEVWEFIHANNVPYNKLHDRHFPSIGCEPCTRSITAGEDVRAGRWWWEDPASKECGLHVKEEPVRILVSDLEKKPSEIHIN